MHLHRAVRRGRLLPALATLAAATAAAAAVAAVAVTAVADEPAKAAAAATPVPTETLPAATAIPVSAKQTNVPLPPGRPVDGGGIDLSACLDAYRSSGDAPAYLCCVDPRLGFCAGVLERAPDGAICTYDWLDVGGPQCCFNVVPPETTGGGGAAAGGGAPAPAEVTGSVPTVSVAEAGAAAAAVAGPTSTPRPPPTDEGLVGPGAPRLAVTCRSVGACPTGAPVRSAPSNSEAKTEATRRCGSWDPATYTMCEVVQCVGIRRGRAVKRNTICGWFGTPAQCCLRIKEWNARRACCRNCSVPGLRESAFGCCYPGPRTGPPPKPGGNRRPSAGKPPPKKPGKPATTGKKPPPKKPGKPANKGKKPKPKGKKK